MGVATQEPFGSLIRRYRRDAELTQEALAERAGLSVRVIRRIESGSQQRPRQDTVRLLLEALDVPAEELGAFRAAAQGREHARSLPVGGYLGAVPESVLVGRTTEVAELLTALELVADGSGRLVVLAGEAGVGKTRLAQEVTLQLRDRGFLLAAGRCYEPEQAIPYYPYLDALTTLLRAAPVSVTQEIPQRWPYLGRLLPDEIALTGPLDARGQAEELLLLRAVTGFLEAVAAHGPLALMLDDLHWADHASITLLLHLARHTRTTRILLLGTYRDVEIGGEHPLRGALRDLDREQLVDRIGVPRLGPADVATLIATIVGMPVVSSELTDLLYERTEGNPFFVRQVVRALMERGDLANQAGAWNRQALAQLAVPETIRSVVTQRLSRLEAETQEVLHEASVLGQTFRFDDLLAMGDYEEAALERALEEAGTAGIVQTVDGHEFRFDHALTQQTLDGALSPRRKRRLHLAAGAAIERLPERHRTRRVAELAWHFLHGDDAERALPYAEQAGDQAAAVFAYSEAELHYRTASELAHKLGDDARAASALWKRGVVLRTVARYDEALDVFGQAARAYRRVGRVEDEARIVVESSLVHWFQGSHGLEQTQIQALLEANANTERSPWLRLARADGRIMNAFHTGDLREWLAAAEEGAALAHSLEAPRFIAWWEAWRAVGLRHTGQPAEGLAIAREAVKWAETATDVQIRYWTLRVLSEGYLCQGDANHALETCERTLEVAERTGNHGWVTDGLSLLSGALSQLGQWPEARQRAARAVDRARLEPRSWYSAMPLLRLGEWCILDGAWEEADRYLAEGIAVAAEIDDPQFHQWGCYSLAELALMRGDPDQALAHLQHGGEPMPWGLHAIAIPEPLASIYLAMGALEQAEDLIGRGLEAATASRLPPEIVPWLRLRAMLLTMREQWDEAAQTFVEAVTLPRSLPYPYAEAQALYEWGRMLAAAGKPTQARKRFGEALTIFQDLGAQPYVERTRQALQFLGSHHPST
jgi:tetratricopeptide (TPR) repeat protein/transcriptional regulator with XRE-family HTH domain